MITINKKDALILINAVFYLFACTISFANLLFPILLFTSSSLFFSSTVSIAIGVSIPATLLVLLVHIYPLVESKINALFHKYSLPLLGLEKSSSAIIKLQDKFFKFLLDCSPVVVIFFTLSIMPFATSSEFIHILLRLMLLLSVLLVIIVMAIDGFYVYFKCFFELLSKFRENNNVDILIVSKLNNTLSFCKKQYKDVTYKPKRLKRKLSVNNLILLFTPSIAGKRKHYMK